MISACQYMTSEDFPSGHSAKTQGPEKTVLIRGGSCIIDPLGKVLVAPTFDEEGVFLAEIDVSTISRGKFDLDVVGHYARPDVFQLRVNRQPLVPVSFTDEVPRTAVSEPLE